MLKAARDKAIQAGPFSVTFSRPKGLSPAGPHDFFSEGPYWWPDPANPEGPYIRRDGERNPNLFTANDDDMGRMSEAVLVLGIAAYFQDDREAAARAWRLLDAWFLAPETLMKPHLEYGQAIRGRTAGRGTGIIDSRPLQWCAAGVALLAASKFSDQRKLEGVKAWFGSYVEWLTTSQKGLDEKMSGNNHATWWAAQVAAYAVLCGDGRAEQAAYAHYRDVLVPSQLQADGSAPREEARTKSLSYSIMNLEGFTLLCRLAGVRGEDLWGFRTPLGASVLRSVEYLAPFVEDPSRWTKQQIAPVGKNRGYFLGLAGAGAHRRDWLELQKKLGWPGGAWGILYGMMLDRWLAPA
jgi:hypothetical protein